MNTSEQAKEILQRYYDGLSRKEGWQSLLSDDIVLTGTVAQESRGKELFVNNNFFKMVKSLHVEQMIVENDNACAVVSYDLISPTGTRFSSDVAEIWKVKDGRLTSLAIYFDTAEFQKAVA
ncbi:MAG: nuclear transport factor 2 family protein [Halobacteriota archaeon]